MDIDPNTLEPRKSRKEVEQGALRAIQHSAAQLKVELANEEGRRVVAEMAADFVAEAMKLDPAMSESELRAAAARMDYLRRKIASWATELNMGRRAEARLLEDFTEQMTR